MSTQKVWFQICLLSALLLASSARAQYTFGPEVQSTPSAGITYNSGTGMFQYTNVADSSDDHAYLPLTGAAATFITTSNGWTVSLTANISASSTTATSDETPHFAMSLVILDANDNSRIVLGLGQINNTGGSSDESSPDGFYGTVVQFAAVASGGTNAATPLGGSIYFPDGNLLVLSGGTNESAATESLDAAGGVLTIHYNASANTVTAYFNGTPVGSYSPGDWGSNPPLNLLVEGLSGEGAGAPVGTVIASNFFAGILSASTPPQFLWSRRVASANSWPEGEPNTGFALDTNDNCYVTGFFDDTNNFGGITLTNQSTGGSDIFVAKYNSAGALQWAQRAGGGAGNFNYGRGIGTDANGNVYVAGGYQSPATFGSINLPATSGEEFFLAKYNSAGVVQWVQTSTGGSDDNDGVGLTVDSSGNCYALAVLDDSGTSLTFGSVTVTPNDGGTTFLILVKYDNTGTAQWARLFDTSQETYGTKVAVDAAGNVYVRGLLEVNMTIGTSNLVVSPANETENMFIAKFNSAGTLIWVQQPQGGNAGEGGVAVDLAGNVFVSGYFDTNLVFSGGITLTNMANSNALFGDAFLAKYNSSGVAQWAQPAGGTNGGFYWDLSLDAQTNIYAGGFVGYDAAVAKYNPAGTLQWTVSASGLPASPASSGVDNCAVDSAGNCYLNGFYQGTATFGTNTLQPQETWNFFLTEVASSTSAQTQYTFGPEVQSTSSASITYNSATDAFQYTNAVGSSGYAYLSLISNAASLIITSNGWTASLAVNLTATTLANNGTGGTPAIGMALAIFSGGFGQDRVLFALEQVNNTAGTDLSDYTDGFYGTAAKFAALTSGNSAVTTQLDDSQSGSEGDSYLVLSGGTDDSPTTESIGNANGVLTLTYTASANTVTGSYNGTPVGSYSLASWGSNPPLTLAVLGESSGANVGVPAGTDTASDFSVSSSMPNPAIQTTGAGFGVQNDQFGFDITGGNGAVVVVEASTNLANPIWIPVVTNTLVNGTNYFSDPQWTNYHSRFYRLTSP